VCTLKLHSGDQKNKTKQVGWLVLEAVERAARALNLHNIIDVLIATLVAGGGAPPPTPPPYCHTD
jgi:hypothetical protein